MKFSEIVEKLKPVYAKIDEQRLNIIFEFFILPKERETAQRGAKIIKDKYGIVIGHRQLSRCLSALKKMGYEVAPPINRTMTKQQYIDEVSKTSRSSIEVITAVYSNLVSNTRKSNHLMAKSLSTETKEFNVQTVKNINHLFIGLGLKVKPVRNQKLDGVKGRKLGTVEGDGVVRWNPEHKLMPEAFKHLDNAW